MILFADSILESLNEILRQFMAGVPNLLKAIIIFIIGWIIAKMVARALKKLLQKIKVDVLGEKLNEIEMVSKAKLDIKLSAVFAKIVYYVLMLFVLVAATEALGMQAVSDLVKDIFNFIPNLIAALMVLILGLLVSEAIKKLVLTAMTSLGIPSARLISSAIFYFLFINVLVSALSQAKINTAFLSQNLTLLIGGGVLAFGIGYGLASKDVLANFLASFYSKEKIRIGDKITLDGVTGEIIAMDKSSIILTASEGTIIIPMSKLSKHNLTIHT